MMWMRNGLQSIPCVDTVIFDMDGVLMDDTHSYYAAVKATVHYVVSVLYHQPSSQALITDADILAFKAAGGFNDDWVLAYTLCGIILANAPGERPALAEIAAQSAGRGMPWVREHYFPKLALDFGLVERLCIEHYWGADLLWERLGIRAEHYHGPGFVRQEQPLVSPHFFDELKRVGIRQFGLITGRSKVELQFGLESLGLSDANPFQCVLHAGDFRKPDPRALEHVMEALKPAAAIYVGDTSDDLQLVLNYRQSGKVQIACLAAIVAKPGQREHFIRAGADLVLDQAGELPEALARLRYL